MCQNACPCPCPRRCAFVDDNALLMSHGEKFRFERGDVLWQASEPAFWMGSVCVGLLEFTCPASPTNGLILDLAQRGQIFGIEAAIENMRRPTTCVALTSGRGIRLKAAPLRALRHGVNGSEISTLLLRAQTAQNVHHATRIRELSLGQVDQRLATVLLRLAGDLGLDDARGTFLPVRLTRSDLARFVSCREETITRLMRRWEKAEIVSTLREGFVFHNLVALSNIAAPQPARATA
jgi:CRP-like cAMP-binding protein